MAKTPKPKPLPETIFDIMFPLSGIDVAEEFGRQPTRPLPDGGKAHTAATGINVRSYPPPFDRLRGGARPGIARFIDEQVEGSYSIQELNVLVITEGCAVGENGDGAGLDSLASDRNSLGGNGGFPPVRFASSDTFDWCAIATIPLTITADDAITALGAPVVFDGTEFTSVGLEVGDSITTVTLTCEGADATIAGGFPIVASAAVGVNLYKYIITYVDGILTVTNE